MTYLVSVKVSEDEYKHFAVPREVYVYIRQLEIERRYPSLSGLKQQYPGRFSEAVSDE